MKPSITLIPYGGLANRMKAIEALIALMEDTGAHGTSIWFKHVGLNCSFAQLFQPLDVPNLTFRDASFADYLLNDRPRKKNLYLPYLLEKIRFDSCLHEDEVTQKTYNNFDFRQWVLSNRRTFLSACLQFYSSSREERFSSLNPIPQLQERINERCENFSNHTIGVHIRRTDNTFSIKNSPTELFIQRMKEEANKYSDVHFYLASDSPEEKKKLISVFGDRIITDWSPVSRSTTQGVQDALVELYALSRTRKIIGSYYSSYSATAAEIGKIPHEVIQQQEKNS